MLENALLTSGLVLAGAALVVPVTNRIMLGSVKGDWEGDELEYDFVGSDRSTVHLKDGSMFRVFCLEGLPYETKPLQEQEALLAGRSSLLHQVGQTGTTISFFGIKRQQDVSFEADWPSKSLDEIGNAEQELYQNSYRTYWYITLENKDYSMLERACGKLSTLLSGYDCKLVQSDKDPMGSCPLTGFITHLVSGELRFDLPVISKHISANIPGGSPAHSTSGILQTRTPTLKLHQCVSIMEWPPEVNGMIISEIMALKGDIEVSQISIPLNPEKTSLGLKRKENEYKSPIFGNSNYASEHKSAGELLDSNQGTLFETQFAIFARANNQEDLDNLIKEICEVLSRRKVIYTVATDAACCFWYDRHPGRRAKRKGKRKDQEHVRKLDLFNENIAALWPFQFSPRGQLSSPFGDRPIRMFKTPTGQSYAFQFHVSDKPQSPGNYMIFAPTGGGKSTLIMHLLGGLAKFPGVRNYVFDSKEGASYMTKTLGGIYQSYDDLQLNPLDVLVNTKTHQHQLNMIIRSMLGDSLTDDMDPHINHAIDLAFELDGSDRTFNDIYEYAFPKDTAIRKSFAKWVTTTKGKEGLYSHVFNAPQDQMTSFLKQSFLVGINMNEALEDPVLGAPVVAHIASAISNAAKASHSGFTIFVDEAANLLRNKGFRDVVLQMYREYRKLNGLVGLAFQDPAALMKFSDHEGILNNTQTLIFLPNSLVKPDDLEPFNLNEEQRKFITGGGHLGEGRQVLVVKRDMTTGYDESAILDVDLTALDTAVKDKQKPTRFYRAGAEANTHLKQIQDQWGPEWVNHI